MNKLIDQTVHAHMQVLANKTIQYLHDQNLKRSRQCIKNAEDIYDNSNEHVKDIITHDFIWPVTTFIREHDLESLDLLSDAFKPDYQP